MIFAARVGDQFLVAHQFCQRPPMRFGKTEDQDLAVALDSSGELDRLKLARILLARPAAGLRLARNGLRALAALERTVEQLCAYVPGAVSPPNA